MIHPYILSIYDIHLIAGRVKFQIHPFWLFVTQLTFRDFCGFKQGNRTGIDNTCLEGLKCCIGLFHLGKNVVDVFWVRKIAGKYRRNEEENTCYQKRKHNQSVFIHYAPPLSYAPTFSKCSMI